MSTNSVGNMLNSPGGSSMEIEGNNSNFVPNILYAKVVENTTEKSDPLYQNSTSLKTIYFIFLKEDDSINEPGGIAAPLFSTSVTPPLLNEIVLIIPNKTKKGNFLYYYMGPVNLFNNGTYDVDASIEDLDENDNVVMGKGISEDKLKEVRKLIPSPGDVLLEGRFGNTIRMGNSNSQTDFKGDENSPITIIRNGQKKVEKNNLDYINEDINLDCSSIYLTCKQTVPIDVISKNMQTFRIEETNTTTAEDILSLDLTKGVRGVIDNDTNATIISNSKSSQDPTTNNNEDVGVTNPNDEAFAKEGENIVFTDTSTDSTSNAETIIEKYRGYTIKRVLSSDSYGNPEQITEHYVIPNIGVESLFDKSNSTAISYFTNIIEESILSGDIKDLTT